MKNRKKLGCREIAGRGGYMDHGSIPYSQLPNPLRESALTLCVFPRSV
jgi:hypothetical protein